MKWTGNQIVVHPYNGILFNNKKDGTCKNMDESQSNYAEQKKPDKRAYTYDSTYIKL